MYCVCDCAMTLAEDVSRSKRWMPGYMRQAPRSLAVLPRLYRASRLSCASASSRQMSSEATSKDKYIFTGTEREQYTKGALDISDVNVGEPFKTFQYAS